VYHFHSLCKSQSTFLVLIEFGENFFKFRGYESTFRVNHTGVGTVFRSVSVIGVYSEEGVEEDPVGRGEPGEENVNDPRRMERFFSLDVEESREREKSWLTSWRKYTKRMNNPFYGILSKLNHSRILTSATRSHVR